VTDVKAVDMIAMKALEEKGLENVKCCSLLGPQFVIMQESFRAGLSADQVIRLEAGDLGTEC
jgi:hypothetical protein